MLPLVISVVWLAVVTLCVTVCQTAAAGDAPPPPMPAQDPPEVICEGLVVWDREAARVLRATMRRQGGRRRPGASGPEHALRARALRARHCR